jgi:hypothetical protein
MKELMWKYLDGAYPNVYYKMTKFGPCLKDGNNPDKVVMRMIMVRQLVFLFDCDEDNGAEVVKKWLEVRPTYENILNSTNPAVLVSDTTVVNSTL